MNQVKTVGSFNDENIYSMPLHPRLGKRSLTQAEICRPRENDHIRYIQCLPMTANTFCQKEPADQIVRKGLMWVQQDKLFSRWRERFIILTPEYLQFFKKGTSKVSEIGDFLCKVVYILVLNKLF